MAFLIFQSSHDPSGQLSGPWTFRILLNQGESVTAGSVTIVDGSDNPIVGSDLTVSNVSFGVIDTDSNVWGVSFYLQAGSPQYYNLRCRYTTTHSPSVGGDITMRLHCKQT